MVDSIIIILNMLSWSQHWGKAVFVQCDKGIHKQSFYDESTHWSMTGFRWRSHWSHLESSPEIPRTNKKLFLSRKIRRHSQLLCPSSYSFYFLPAQSKTFLAYLFQVGWPVRFCPLLLWLPDLFSYFSLIWKARTDSDVEFLETSSGNLWP